MNINDLVSLDNLSNLPAELLDLLSAFGFTQVKVSRDASLTYHFCVVEALRPDGTGENWSAAASSPEQAESFVRVHIEEWILNQPIPYTP